MKRREFSLILMGVVLTVAVIGVIAPRPSVQGQVPTSPPVLIRSNILFSSCRRTGVRSLFRNISWCGRDSVGSMLADSRCACESPYHSSALVNAGGGHFNEDAIADIDGGLMDGFASDSPGDSMSWHDFHEIPNYWSYAQLYVLQDRLFESVQSYSLPAHLYMLAAQSGGYLGGNFGYLPIPQSYSFPEITELLTSGQIDWRYYVNRGDTPGAADNDDGANVDADEKTYTFWNPLPAFPAVATDPTQFGRLPTQRSSSRMRRMGPCHR